MTTPTKTPVGEMREAVIRLRDPKVTHDVKSEIEMMLIEAVPDLLDESERLAETRQALFAAQQVVFTAIGAHNKAEFDLCAARSDYDKRAEECERLRAERDAAEANAETFRANMYAVEEAHSKMRQRAEAAERERDEARAALRDAATSLSTCARWGTKAAGEHMQDFDQLHGYATNRAAAALATIDAKPEVAKPPCRRCSECVGEEHHWSVVIRTDSGDWECKHCDAVSEGIECSTCQDDIPLAIANEDRDCPSCAKPEVG